MAGASTSSGGKTGVLSYAGYFLWTADIQDFNVKWINGIFS